MQTAPVQVKEVGNRAAGDAINQVAAAAGHQQRTPYARWMAVTGLWPLAAWALVVLGLALWQHRRGKLRCATS